MFESPLSKKEILEKYSKSFARKLLSDSVHLWRAETGIELIHREPSKDELVRIWKNWNNMSDDMKKKSDNKSFELFGKSNKDHYDILINNY